MARYTAAQIYAFALDAGFDRESATTMTAVALAESGGRSTAHNPVGEDSRGLWQINAAAHPDLAERYDLYDPRQNAAAAFEVSQGGQDVSPWTTTHGGARASYLRHRDAAQAAAVAHGDPAGMGMWSGTEGYGDTTAAGPGAGAGAGAPAGDGGWAAAAVATSESEAAHGLDLPAAPGAEEGPDAARAVVLGETSAVLAPDGGNPFEPDGGNPFEPGGGAGGGNPFEPGGGAAAPPNPFDPFAPASPVTQPAAQPPAASAATAEQTAPIPVVQPVPGTPPQPPAGGAALDTFVGSALGQTGDPYVFGANAEPGDADPAAFDCSELVRWSAHQAGVELPDGSWLQFLDLQQRGLIVPVEQGVDTRGALLFSFSSEPVPGGPRPTAAHVAISLGDGSTIEARGRAYGVGSFDAGQRFEYAALVPGISAGPAAAGTRGIVAPAGEPGTPLPAPDAAAGAELHGLDLGAAGGFTAPAAVNLDTDLGAGGEPRTVVLDGRAGLDPYPVDADEQQLADSLELLFPDEPPAGLGDPGMLDGTPDGTLDAAMDGALDTALADGTVEAVVAAGPAADPLLDAAPLDPIDGFAAPGHADPAVAGTGGADDPAPDAAGVPTDPADPADPTDPADPADHDPAAAHGLDLPAFTGSAPPAGGGDDAWWDSLGGGHA